MAVAISKAQGTLGVPNPRRTIRFRPYQQEFVDAAHTALRDGGAGQIRMACGSGKTIVSQRAAERLVPAGGTVGLLVPSLGLIAQSLAS